jgi:hypothetical protein
LPLSRKKISDAAASSAPSGRVELRTSTLLVGILTVLFLVPLGIIGLHHLVSSDRQLPAGSPQVQITANAPAGQPNNTCSIDESWPYAGHGYVELVHLSGACPATGTVSSAWAAPGGHRLLLSGGDKLTQRPADYDGLAVAYALLACLGLGATVFLRRGDRESFARAAPGPQRSSGGSSRSVQPAH